MNEITGDATGASRRPWQAPEPGSVNTARWAAQPNLRVSDADRDAAVAELSRHFQEGRLDQAEFDDRMSRALNSRTGRELGMLLTDLPAAEPSRAHVAAPAWRGPHPAAFVPLLVAVLVLAGFAFGGRHHPGGWAPWPLIWVIPMLVLRLGWWRRAQRGRQWR